jgi:hypothetical protein
MKNGVQLCVNFNENNKDFAHESQKNKTNAFDNEILLIIRGKEKDYIKKQCLGM